MEKLNKIAKFIFDNRRTIGLIVGGMLTLAGYPDHGKYVSDVGGV